MRQKTITALLLFLSMMLFYTSGFGQFGVMVQRGIPLMVSLVAIFLLFPLHETGGGARRKTLWMVVDIVLIGGSVFSIGYVVVLYAEIADRMGITTIPDVIAAVIGLVCVLEATRRTTGNALPVLGVLVLLYVFVGPYMPGLLYHDGFNLNLLARMEWTGLTGVFGTILNVMVTVIFIFMLLAEFLRATRAGDFILETALSLTGRLRGGPALTAVMASSLFGSISGSPVANVMGSGTFTIPLMKRTGFEPRIAAAIEAASSAGGYLMPPVMGAAAFIMAELTGIPYVEIALIALIPSLVYYGSLFVGVYTYSLKRNARRVPSDELPNFWQVLKKGAHVFVIFPILIGTLILGYTPAKACFYTLIALLVLCTLRSETRIGLRTFFSTLASGAEKSLGIMTACATMGIIFGAMELTGMGTSLGFSIEMLASRSLFLCLVLVMIAAAILGMGVAPVATYVLLIVILAPVLETLGLPLIVAHMYVLYFSTYAVITPPVALAAFAAAGLAQADPFRTGIEAFQLGLPGFLLPFLFVYYPALLLTGGFAAAMMCLVMTLLVVLPLNAANYGYLLGSLRGIPRALIVLAAALMGTMIVSPYLFVTGVAILAAIVWLQYTSSKQEGMKGEPSTA